MCRGVEHHDEVAAMMARADVVAIGPGLGQDAWAAEMWLAATQSGTPLVMDADALNILARESSFVRSTVRVITPHPTEAARLLGSSTAEIQSDRLAAVRRLAERHNCVAVLKGACSLVASQDAQPSICDRGNPGMATAGMGDVLTGVVAALLAQLGDPKLAAQIAVWVHATAGDKAAAVRGERGLIASDLFEYVRECVNPSRRH